MNVAAILKQKGREVFTTAPDTLVEAVREELFTHRFSAIVGEMGEMLRRTVRAERLAAVGTLAAGLAHEVRNPLNSANLQLQVLKRRLAKGQPDGVAQSAVFAVGSGFGWLLAITLLAAIRERLAYSDPPEGLRGLGIAFVTAGLVSLGFMAFAGIELG